MGGHHTLYPGQLDQMSDLLDGVWNSQIDSPWDVPVVGPWIGRTGRVIDIISNPCDPSPTIVVTAFFHDLPRLLIALYKPDMNDQVTARWGGGHKRRRKGKFKVIDMLTSEIPVPKNRISSAIFRLGKWADAAGWFMMAVDATTDFAVHWTSTVYEWAGCQVPGAPFARAKGNDGTYGSDETAGYDIGDWVAQDWHIFGADGNGVESPPGYEVSVSVSVVYGPPDFGLPPVTAVTFFLYDQVADLRIAYVSPKVTSDGFFVGTITHQDFSHDISAHDFRVKVLRGPGYYTWHNSHFILFGTRDKGILADP